MGKYSVKDILDKEIYCSKICGMVGLHLGLAVKLGL